jgi:hypothetical protein
MDTSKTRNANNSRNKGSTRNAKKQQGMPAKQEQGIATVRTSETKVTPLRDNSRDASRSRGWQQ